jgi:drug/metabolite transporter (DMT)-like permease
MSPRSWAALCPIATVTVLPLAVANGGMFGMSVTCWTYTLILTFMTGVAAHGLMVFAQRTIQIGTIGISQVIQPALAVLWSFVLLGERLRPLQALGITIVMAGLFAFLVLNQRGGPTRRATESGDAASVPIPLAAVGTEVLPEPREALARPPEPP